MTDEPIKAVARAILREMYPSGSAKLLIGLEGQNVPQWQEAIRYAQAAEKARPVVEGGEWFRLGDRLPEICEPILLAHKRTDEDFWRVRDAQLYIRYEEVSPSVDDLKDGKRPANWWFDCIYPGKGDMRLASADLLWRPMPTPASPTPPASEVDLEGVAVQLPQDLSKSRAALELLGATPGQFDMPLSGGQACWWRVRQGDNQTTALIVYTKDGVEKAAYPGSWVVRSGGYLDVVPDLFPPRTAPLGEGGETKPVTGWLPIVLCPTDGVDRALLLPDGREVMGAFHNEGFGLRMGWCTSEAVEYDVPVYEEPLRGGFIMPGSEYKARSEPERKQVGTRKQVVHVTGKLPEGVYPTHFRPNDTSWGDAETYFANRLRQQKATTDER